MTNQEQAKEIAELARSLLERGESKTARMLLVVAAQVSHGNQDEVMNAVLSVGLTLISQKPLPTEIFYDPLGIDPRGVYFYETNLDGNRKVMMTEIPNPKISLEDVPERLGLIDELMKELMTPPKKRE